MKNLKSLFSVILIAFTMIAITSCGGDDPEPQKTDLELVKEGILGTWDLVSVEMQDGTLVTGNDLCPPNGYIADLMFIFNSDSFANQFVCGVETTNPNGKLYTVSETAGVFTVTVGSLKFEILTTPADINGSTVVTKRTDNIDGANGSIWTFNKM